jgi:hypothetical protein
LGVAIADDLVQAFWPARHGGPKGPHYTQTENALGEAIAEVVKV